MTHTYTFGFRRQGEEISVQKEVTVVGEQTLGDPTDGLAVPIGTNVEHAFAVDVSQVNSVYISSDTAMTIKTNSSGSPDATITVPAGIPVTWVSGGPGTNPLGAVDVTKLYITNAAAAVLRIRTGLSDATP